MSRFPVLAVLLAAACSRAEVVREGPGWREVKLPEGKTRVELTSDDPAAVAEVARTHEDPAVRGAAVDRATDPMLLAEIARKDPDAGVRKRAVARVADRRVLEEVASSDADAATAALAAERRDVLRWVGPSSPEYAAWSSRPSGAWIRYRIELRASDGPPQILEVLRTLARVGPEGAVVEQRDAARGGALPSAIRRLLDRADAPGGRRLESFETLELGGRRLDCAATQASGQFGEVVAKVKIWRSEELPGGLARADVTESPLGSPPLFLRLSALGWGAP